MGDFAAQSTNESDLERGAALLGAGDWHGAKALYEASLAATSSPEALVGLADAEFWLGEIQRAVELRERAYLAFRERGDTALAARSALWLATEYSAALGNDAVSGGWLGRAERLIDEIGPCAERGWLLLRRSRRSGDPAVAEQLAAEALELAKAHTDRDLEIAAISQRGRALLAAGRTDDGFACLDEAMAAATSGEVKSAGTISDTCCDMIVACERAMEFERATQWCQVTDEYARRYKFLPLFAFCRVTYAGVLMAVGRWSDAERELGEALRSYQASIASKSFLAVAKLAELRLLQGRDAEAEELLAEHAQHPLAAKALGLLYLARGDAPMAARVLAKRLAAVHDDVLVAAPLLFVLVEARVAAGDLAGADEAAARLAQIAQVTGCAAFAATATHADALVKCARAEPAAVECFEAAIHAYASVGMPLPGARARLALARCLADRDPRAAKQECRSAIAVIEELGAKRDLDASADLRRLLGVGARLGPRSTSALTKREQEVLALLGLGLSNAKIAERLFISPKTVEHHVGRILDKLELETRAGAAAYAAKQLPKKPGVA